VTMDSRLQGWLDDPVTRRQVLRGALSGGAVLAAGGVLSACGGGDEGGGNGGGGSGGAPASGASANAKLRAGGKLRVGATGGGASDTIDAHRPTADTDIMRAWNMYESLAVRTPDFEELQMLLAESIEPGKTTKTWDIRLKQGLTFHNGKPVTADDVISSIQRITDPKDPKVGAASIG
jgi:peptide/nickel transport system substrate-binding protein